MSLTKKQIEYELGVHDCGQDPYCTFYRGCSGSEEDKDPIPSLENLEELKIHYREWCINLLNKTKLKVDDIEFTIKEWAKEHWDQYYNIK